MKKTGNMRTYAPWINWVAVVILAIILGGLSALSISASLGLVAAAGLVLVALLWPIQRTTVFLYYCLLATLPFQVYINIAGFPLSTAYLCIGSIAILIGITYLGQRSWWVLMPREFWPMLLLFLIMALSLLHAVDRAASIILLVQIAAYYVVFIVTLHIVDTPARLYRAVALILAASGISSALGVAQAIVGFFAPRAVAQLFFLSPLAPVILGQRNLERLGTMGPDGPITLYRGITIEGAGNVFRGFGLFEGPTVYGWFSVMIAALALGLWLSLGSGTLRTRAGVVAVLSSTAVLVSWTRSAWLALLLSAAFVLAFRRASTLSLRSLRWWQFGAAAVGLIGLVLVFGLLLSSTALGRVILSAVGGAESAGSNAGRVDTARFALGYIRQHPWRGAGFGNYAYVASGGTVTQSTPTSTTAHNTYLELTVELGLPGVLTFIWLLVTVFQRSVGLVKQPRTTFWHALGVGFAATWITFASILMFGGNIIHPKWMTCWWILAALQVRASMLVNQQPTEPREILPAGRI